MADFLTRLARRTLSLVPTVQPLLAPMHAPQFPGAEDAQRGIPDSPGQINHAPAPEAVTEYSQRAVQGQEHFPQKRLPGTIATNNLLEQADYMQNMSSPLVSQENQPSIAPIQEPAQTTHRPGSAPDVQAASDWLSSLEIGGTESAADVVPAFHPASHASSSSTRSALSQEQSTRGDHHSGPYEEAKVTVEQVSLSPRQVSPDDHTLPHPALIDLIAPFERQDPMEAAQMPAIGDNLSVQRRSEQRGVHPQQHSNGVGELKYSSNRIDIQEAASVPQESSAPTIQVTIGRIEVRAMPAQKGPSRDTSTRSGPAVMGLEEYLNQRAKGGY